MHSLARPMHQANGLKIESSAGGRLHMNFHELGNPAHIRVSHRPTSTQRPDVDLPSMVVELTRQDPGAKFGTRWNLSRHGAARRLYERDMLLQRSYAAHVCRHHRSDRNDAD